MNTFTLCIVEYVVPIFFISFSFQKMDVSSGSDIIRQILCIAFSYSSTYCYRRENTLEEVRAFYCRLVLLPSSSNRIVHQIWPSLSLSKRDSVTRFLAFVVYSGAWGKLFQEKNLKSKISWHGPFKFFPI
jgi:hypothetical protein